MAKKQKSKGKRNADFTDRKPIAAIETDPQRGLSDREVETRKNAGWLNTEVESNSKTMGQIIRTNVLTYFNMIFFVLAVALALVRAWINMTFMVVVITNIIIGVVQEWRSKRTLDKLNLLSAQEATVIRNGRSESVSVHETVRDDIVILSAGEQIYADAIVADGECLVNESLLTGEADELRKTKGDTLLSGSFLVSGECRARLTAVGPDSYMSKLSLQAKQQGKQPQSQMMKSLSRLVMVIGIIIIPLGILMAFKEIYLLGQSIPDGVVSTVASLVGMIPEGLYLLTSVALVAGVMRLSRRKTLVHEMGCIETLARVDTLCLDKTGTITEQKMIVKDMVPLDGVKEDEVRSIMSDYVYAMRNDNETMAALKRYFTGEVSRKALKALPFTSARKYGGVAFKGGETYVLGAPENILANKFADYQDDIEVYSRQGCRVLLLAGYDGKLEENGLNGEASPIALILLTNKIRKEAPETFRYFREQGVTVKVISGDSPVTVSEVACRAEIPNAEKYVDARTLRDDQDIARAAGEYVVFGRVTPEQKRKLIRAMHNAGHTVAMTGDGVNDVLALKEADCSVAIASGSQVACQVSHIVLMDSNFSSMPSVVAEGRRVINNIERSTSLYLVKNIFSLCLAIVSLIFTFTYPFTPNQMSLVSLITIGYPSFVLALEPNDSPIRGHFLSNAIYRALPSALSDLVLSIGVVLFFFLFGLTESEMSTICTIVVGVVGLLMVHRTCKPYNTLRKVLMVSCVIGFFGAATLLRVIFSIEWMMSAGAWLVMAVILLLAFEVSFSAHNSAAAIYRFVQMIRKRFSGAKE